MIKQVLDYVILHWQILTIVSLYCITWLPILKLNGFVSDDIEGIAKFSDYFRAETKDAPELLVDYYQFEVGKYLEPMGKMAGPIKVGEQKDKDGKVSPIIRCKNTQLNPYIGFPGCFLRWFRLNFGKTFKVIGKNKKGHEVYGNVQDPVKHHALSLIVHFCNILLCYNFFRILFGDNIAFLATALFTVHPTSCQTVAWISGINYLLSLFGALAIFNIVLLHLPVWYSLPLLFVFSGISCFTLLLGCFNWIIIWMIGGTWSEIAVAVAMALLVAWNQGKEVVLYRKKAFVDQQMGKSTNVNFRKPIVMLKTLAYYALYLPFPKRMGLFHVWGYHYDEKIERTDLMFLGGLLTLTGLCVTAFYSPFVVRLGIVWMLVYVFTFLNLITAQQFVADRYVFIPSLGFSLLLAYSLQSYPIILSFVLGLYLMRTWIHFPTFKDEIHFYESNYWNFPTSEVALGNLGVVCMSRGHAGTAIDVWRKSAELNPFYDVAHYNLYSIYRSNGMLKEANEFIQKCINSKVVHFPDQWKKEAEELDRQIHSANGFQNLGNDLYKHMKEANYERYNSV